MASTCRILVTDEVPDLAGTSYLGPDGTVWIVVSPQAEHPCQLLAELVSDAFDGGLPEVLIYERAYTGGPPQPAGEVRRLVAGGVRAAEVDDAGG